MDVRRPFLHGIGENQVYELDDRGIFRRPRQIRKIDFLVVLYQIDVGIVEVAHDVFEGRRLVVVFVDGPPNGLFRGDDGLDVVAGQKLDVVQSVDIRRIRGRQDQGRARPVDGDDRVLGGDLLGNQLNHRRLDLELVDVDGGNTVLLGDEVREIGLVQEAELGNLGAETPALDTGFITGLPKLVRREQVLLDEEFPDPFVHAARCPPDRADSHSRRPEKQRSFEWSRPRLRARNRREPGGLSAWRDGSFTARGALPSPQRPDRSPRGRSAGCGGRPGPGRSG